MTEFQGPSGFKLCELTPAQLPSFIEVGVDTCAFMHGRPDISPDRMRQHFSSFVRDYAFTSDSEIYFVKSDEGDYAGQIWLHSVRNVFNRRMELWIWDLTVCEKFRNRGIGRALLRFAISRAVQMDCVELWLLVSSKNDKAVKLYQAAGLSPAGHLMMIPVAGSTTIRDRILSVQSAELRPLNPIDINDLYKLWNAAGLSYRPEGRDREDRLRTYFGSPRIGGWGCWTNNELIGATIISNDGRKGWIERLAVHPASRRSGFAKALVMSALGTLKEQGALVIGALIGVENEASRKLFEGCGFTYDPGFLYYSIRDNPNL